ncbi:MAG: UTRA domain-containing protein [Coriobacteriales bacterium]|nr:UTRA domain-containing protein [Coriobacteriales bacterium]
MQAAYIGIYQEIKESIERGTCQFGSFLPSESALVARFGCAHNTVRKALEILAREGYVQPIHGKGVRVIYRPLPPFFDVRPNSVRSKPPHHPTTEKYCDVPSVTKILTMEELEANEEFATSTGFPEGEQLLHLESVRSYKRRALEREHNYYRADIVQGITKQIAQESVYDYIENVNDVQLVTFKRMVYMVHADERDYELLDMGDADYLALVLCAVYDSNATLCEVTASRQHPDLFAMLQVARHTRLC